MSLSTKQQQTLNTFISVTNANVDTAKQFLQATGWDLNFSIDWFFVFGDDSSDTNNTIQSSVNQSSITQNEHEEEEEREEKKTGHTSMKQAKEKQAEYEKHELDEISHKNDNIQSIIFEISGLGITDSISRIQNAMQNVADPHDMNEIVDYIFNQQDNPQTDEIQNELLITDEMKEDATKKIIINHNKKKHQYVLNSNVDEWDNKTYLDLIESTKNALDLNDNFNLYELVEGDMIDIDDIDDIKDAFDDQTNGDKIHVYVKVNGYIDGAVNDKRILSLEWHDLMEGVELQDFNSMHNKSSNVNIAFGQYSNKHKLKETKKVYKYIDPRRLLQLNLGAGLAIGAADIAADATVGCLGTMATAAAGTAIACTATIWAGHSGLQYWRNHKENNKLQKKQQYNVKIELFNAKLIALQEMEDILLQKTHELSRQEEKTNNVTFRIERKYTLTSKVVVCIGPTGYGKSLVCNRLIGNKQSVEELAESKDAEYDVADLGDSISKTKELQKTVKEVIIKDNNEKSFILSVVDTAGAWDSNHIDEDFQNEMAVYFGESGGINMFCIFFMYGTKWDQKYKQLLTSYTKFWGKQFWKHCVIVITKCDEQDIYLKKGLPNTIKQIKGFLKEFAGNVDIPIYQFGENNFKTSTQNLLLSFIDIETIYSQKYKCDHIVSPIDKLWDEIKPLIQKIQRLTREINTLSKEIKQSENEVR